MALSISRLITEVYKVNKYLVVRQRQELVADFGVMMAHHVVTVILITFSHWARLLRIGTMVFLAHDVSDVPLELAKASRYANIDGLTNVFFAIFFLVWIMSRIVYFPAVSLTLSFSHA